MPPHVKDKNFNNNLEGVNVRWIYLVVSNLIARGRKPNVCKFQSQFRIFWGNL